MNKYFDVSDRFNLSSKILLWIFLLVVVLTTLEITFYSYQSNNNSLLIEKKRKAISLTQLPDIALVTETVWIRHRSISNVFSIFPEDGTLLDYYPASFVYNPNLNQNNLQSQSGSNEF